MSKRPIGARFFKADLHFHTPASEDARGRNKYNFNPYNIKYPPKKGNEQTYYKNIKQKQNDILFNSREVAEKIIQRFLEENLSLVAISDHNSIGTIWAYPESTKKTMDLTAPTWYEIIDDAAQKANEKAGKIVLTILPSVEISCTGVHILAVFPPTTPRRSNHFIICQLLNEIGFKIEEWGKNPKVGKRSLIDAVNLIKRKGGIPCLAHIDGSDQATLQLYKLKSGAMKNVFYNKNLSAVEIVNPGKFSKLDKTLKVSVKNLIDSLRRKKNLTPLAYFQGSDAHDYKTIGKRYAYVKMTEPSFEGLENCIHNPSTRVRISTTFSPVQSGLFVYGVEIDSKQFGKQLVRFNRHLNCITGKKETGKSNICQAMKSAVNKDFIKPGSKVKLFVEIMKDAKSSYKCFTRNNNGDDPFLFTSTDDGKILRKDNIDNWQKSPVKVNFYNPDRINEIIASRKKLEEFLVNNFGVDKKEGIKKFNEKYTTSGFLDPKKEELLFLEKNGHLKLFLNINWKKGETRRMEFQKLRRSLKRTVMIMMIIMNDRFGPVIIDSPEESIDNIDISDFLVPIIIKHKDFRQIILFTSNPTIAVNSDPENFILLEPKSITKTKITSGFSIEKSDKKDEVINILEGGVSSYDKRSGHYHLGLHQGR
ncbi:hypothetical protein SCALIN_C29_0085 [Candidatus Scalindua japonica]|uniref:Uncharacterized protein n=2 Tax=Candidatus Scalindua japonica TaxID=1284222 RepID=A0A286U2K8_9BACT|nr:hypothetical protein SCALIN_C29_0085 [Candidatus Scalindua japonica]